MTSVSEQTSQAAVEVPGALPETVSQQLALGPRRTLGLLVLVVPAAFLLPSPVAAILPLWVKLYLTGLAWLCGLALLRGYIFSSGLQVEIDTVCHEVRLVQQRRRDRLVVKRCSFRDLSMVDQSATHLRLWDADSALIAEVPLSDTITHRGLSTALRVAGKI